MVVTRRSLGRTPFVWALALSGLLTVAGAGVWARSRHDGQAGQAPPQQASQRGPHDGPGPQFPGRGPAPATPLGTFSAAWDWWKDDAVKKEIGLRPEQSNRIDSFYSSRMKQMDPVVQEYQKEQAILDKMVSDRTVDDSTLTVEITKWYALRAEVGRSRLLMDYRIAKVLDVDQYAKLKAIADRRLKEAEARRGRGGGLAPVPGGLPR